MTKRFKGGSAGEHGWNPNTELGCNVKTILSSDRRMKTGKGYRGVLSRDTDAITDEFLCRDAHYTFIETLPETDGKRNPRVFSGRFITITRRDDGSLRLNFRRMETVAEANIDGYAIGVCNELRRALRSLTPAPSPRERGVVSPFSCESTH